MRFRPRKARKESNHFNWDDHWENQAPTKLASDEFNNGRGRSASAFEFFADSVRNKKHQQEIHPRRMTLTRQRLPPVTLNPRPLSMEDTANIFKDFQPNMQQQHQQQNSEIKIKQPSYSFTMDPGEEPVWKKRLRNKEAERRSLQQIQAPRAQTLQTTVEEVNNTRPMRSISLSNQKSTFDGCLSIPIATKAEPKDVGRGYTTFGTTASSISGLSSSVSGLFHRMTAEEEFSVQTPSVRTNESSFLSDSYVLTSDADTSYASTNEPMLNCSPSRKPCSKKSHDEEEDPIASCLGVDPQLADDFDLFSRFLLGQVSCYTCLTDHRETRRERRRSKRGNARAKKPSF